MCGRLLDEAFILVAYQARTAGRQTKYAKPIVLLLDGHGSHITPRVRKLAYENKIFLFCLPPKTNHKAQPLDVAIFNLVQAAWKPACGEAAQNGEVASKASTSIVSSIKTHLPQSFPIFPVPASSSDTASLLSGVASPEELLLQAIHESLEVPSNSQHQSTPTQALQSRRRKNSEPA